MEKYPLFSNPANIGFYKTGDFVISGGANMFNNNLTYLGVTEKDNKTNGFLGTTGFVLGKPNYGQGSLKSSAFGIAINRVADFNNRMTFTNKGGQLSRTSMADYFIEDVVANNGFNDYGSGLALDAGWIEEDGDGNLSSSAVDLAIESGLEQKQVITTNGGITEFAIAGAANLNEKVFLGGSIGMPILRYGQNRQYTEQDPTTDDNGFDAAWFDDDLVTKGVGINIKAGVVFKATENLRLGFAAHSPTFYSMSDSYVATAGANLDDFDAEASSNELVYDYNLNTPYKLMGSFSVLFGNVNDVSSQKGFVSGDVEYVNYMASNFRTTSDDQGANNGYFRDLNNVIDDAYKGAINARLGTELKFNVLAVRFGGAYYGNPYKNLAGEKGELVQATGGLGYRNKGFFIDLGYVHSFQKDVIFPYRLTTADFYPANIKSNNSRILLTLGFKI
ncbi:aromatic hydrocarbon degradation protein [Niabella ginsengisoli]|uniref:Aromatic hydrocarbon degradation protein n=1 Tax=Niabella ginsengisoli TaxID=522298 RepID=A0ABS9SES1_9BACT|nr:aromatic hydrocarbon degradation protein [Niabella ginsengisoli]MCH5596862.1 aromatic hydrocarbon degradation protein [Niabella ginsengisoli]